MARGFESKSVADQQDAADAPFAPHEDRGDPKVRLRRQRLELARSDVLHRIETAQARGHREMLDRALQALETELKDLPDQ